MTRIERITQVIRQYDRDLSARMQMGQVRIFRRVKRWEFYAVDDNEIGFLKEDSHLVCALTHDWTVKGRPVDWGLEPIMQKIRSSDLWNRDKLADELIASYEKSAESRQRHVRNEAEAFASDFRPAFAKAFNDVNTSTISKIETNLRKREKKWLL